MAEQQEDRYIVDATDIVLEAGHEIPQRLYGSKYPWAQLIEDIDSFPSFFVPFPDEETANRLRVSIHSSGRAYYQAREIPLGPVTRVLQNEEGTWGVRAWARPVEEAEADEAEEEAEVAAAEAEAAD